MDLYACKKDFESDTQGMKGLWAIGLKPQRHTWDRRWTKRLISRQTAEVEKLKVFLVT